MAFPTSSDPTFNWGSERFSFQNLLTVKVSTMDAPAVVIAAITPDIIRPKTTRLPEQSLTVRESFDNIRFGSRRVRVQTVNAKHQVKKCLRL